jgi:hypothetical protein
MTRPFNSNNSPRIEFQVHFRTGLHGRRHLRKGACQKEWDHPGENLPGLTRLLAHARRWSQLIDEGATKDYAEFVSTVDLSSAWVTQIMNMLYLAPEIQEDILSGEIMRPISERIARSLTRVPEWTKQRMAWRKSE